MAGSITMVFIFQPILMSFLPVPAPHRQVRKQKGALGTWFSAMVDKLVHVPLMRGAVRETLLIASAVFLIFGVFAGLHAKIGYSTVGTPLYRANAKVNRDIMVIGRKFPLEEGWVILTMPKYPSQQCAIAPRVLRLESDFRNYMMEDPRVRAVTSFSSQVEKPFNQMFHYGDPKYLAIPASLEMSGNLWGLYLNGTAPGELERYMSTQNNADTCIRVMMTDHTYDTLNDIRDRIQRFVALRLAADPGLNQVKAHYMAGMAGLYLAANDVLYKLDFMNITFVLAVIFIFCVLTYRSFAAGILFILSCVLANFGAFIYMGIRGIGLTIHTIPVISLGIGLGVDYGIYTVSRIRDEVLGGATLEDATLVALRHTGAAVLATFSVMVSGIVPWVFSPLLFHNQMSILLIFLMGTNMVAGVLVLPSFIMLQRPKFVFGGKVPQVAAPKVAAVAD